MRFGLVIITNLGILLVLGVVTSVLGVGPWLHSQGLNLPGLLAFAAIFGFGGSFISLLLSKPMAKWSTGAKVIESPSSNEEKRLLASVQRLADKAGVRMPQVAIYEGQANAFATGAFRNSALIGVSTGLLQSMNEQEVDAVLAHEMAHIANGDMITLGLVQGVLNTFVIFISRVVGYLVDSALSRGQSRGIGIGYWVTVIAMDLILGIVAAIIVAWFSRYREFRADAGSAHLMGDTAPMISALQRLGGMQPGELPKAMSSFGIAGGLGAGMSRLLSTHPPIEQRIAALRNN